MEKAKIERVDEILEKLKGKDFNMYFFTLDTKGNPSAGVANIYEHVKMLNEMGYKAHILHEKNDYLISGDEDTNGATDWLGAEYGELSHVSIEAQTLKVKAEDFIFIPEIFSTIMGQVKAFPCKKVVFSQSPAYMFELLPLGTRWSKDYGFNDVITTSVKQGNYVKSHFPTVNTHVIPVGIPEYFSKSDKPQKPIIAILARDNTDINKIVKSFYLQYPLYNWLTFKDMRGMSRKDFAKSLKESCLAVWVDDRAGFGTFPIEAMNCGVPVIGKIPDMIPEWMISQNEDGKEVITHNGVWTNTTQNIPELISTYIKLYLEDNLPEELTKNMSETTNPYTMEVQRTTIEGVYGKLITNRISEIEGLKPKEEVKIK